MNAATNPLGSGTGSVVSHNTNATGEAPGLPAPPPRHPHDAPAAGSLVQPSLGSGNSHAAPSATTGAGGSNPVGEKASGVFGAIHGAGEALRGTINSTLDGLGDAVAGRKEPAASRSGAEGNAVAEKGMAEVREGYAKVAGGDKLNH